MSPEQHNITTETIRYGHKTQTVVTCEFFQEKINCSSLKHIIYRMYPNGRWLI